MKKYLLVLLILSFVVFGLAAFIQAEEDYYPLQIGNYWVFKSIPLGDSERETRTTKTSVDSTDVWENIEYFRVNRITLGTERTSFSWYRKDAEGNVAVYAFGSTPDISSARAFFETPRIIFPKDAISLGNSWESTSRNNNVFYKVESVSEKVTVPAGTFDSCIKLRRTTINSDGDTLSVNQDYYAPGIGNVLSVSESRRRGSERMELSEYSVKTPQSKKIR